MNNIQIIFTNKLDVEVLDSNFYYTLLEKLMSLHTKNKDNE